MKLLQVRGWGCTYGYNPYVYFWEISKSVIPNPYVFFSRISKSVIPNPYVFFTKFSLKSVILANPYVIFSFFLQIRNFGQSVCDAYFSSFSPESVILVNQKLFLDYQHVKLFSFFFLCTRYIFTPWLCYLFSCFEITCLLMHILCFQCSVPQCVLSLNLLKHQAMICKFLEC